MLILEKMTRQIITKAFNIELLSEGMLMPLNINDPNWLNNIRAALLVFIEQDSSMSGINLLSSSITKSYRFWLSENYTKQKFNEYCDLILDVLGDNPYFDIGKQFLKAARCYKNTDGDRKCLLTNLRSELRELLEEQIAIAKDTNDQTI